MLRNSSSISPISSISSIPVGCSAMLMLVFALAAAAADEAPQRHRQLWESYADQLGDPAKPRGFGSQYFLPSEQFTATDKTIEQAADVYAQALTLLAREQLQADPAFAYQLLHEAAYYGRDNLADRIVQAKPMALTAKLGTTSHPRLKWKRREYYRISSEHYQIVARDEQAGLEIAQRLEMLYGVWRQLFFDCWSDQDELRRAIDREKTLAPRTSRLHRVVLFSRQEDYVQFLQKAQPRIGITRGFYDIATRTSYFFDSQPKNISTQYHEVTHQLFQELQRVPDQLPLEQNFWALEGVAMYMESLRRHGPLVSLGGFAARRLQFARYRRLQEDFYVSLDELVRMGRDQLQDAPDIRRLYSQSAGLAQMMIEHEDGRYRRGFVDYVRSIYEGRDRPDSLGLRLDTDTSTLDADYVRFLKIDDQRMGQSSVAADSLQSLCLGHTGVTNAGLKQLPTQRKLEWLDLAGLPVQRSGLDFIRETTSLQQVSFDRCALVDDEVVQLIAQNPDLDELDLTATAITDAGLKYLAGHAKLQTLWVGGTQLTDASIPILLRLPSLRQIQCSGSGISPAALRQLQAEKPDLTVEP